MAIKGIEGRKATPTLSATSGLREPQSGRGAGLRRNRPARVCHPGAVDADHEPILAGAGHPGGDSVPDKDPPRAQ